MLGSYNNLDAVYLKMKVSLKYTSFNQLIVEE